jgi:hypothetical protein
VPLYQTTRPHIPEDHTHNTDRHENLKFSWRKDLDSKLCNQKCKYTRSYIELNDMQVPSNLLSTLCLENANGSLYFPPSPSLTTLCPAIGRVDQLEHSNCE